MTSPPSTRAVVWWKTSLGLAEIPRRHTIGWSDTSGVPHGAITIASPHLRLDRRTIETALAVNLAQTYPTPPRLGPVAELADQLTPEARLRAAGHQVLTRNLTAVYGHRTIGGVVATLLGRGVNAHILIDHGASPSVRKEVCQAAEHALAEFVVATPDELYDADWERGREDRWQLLLEQR